MSVTNKPIRQNCTIKAADLIERVCGHPLQFAPNIGLLYVEPRAGLDMFGRCAE
jgi:hypothetical protein